MHSQSPDVLAQLPQPVLHTDGKTQFGPCYGLSRSRKRKRFEIAAAIDGETLNIYNIQASQLVSSYAVPPVSAFQCPPTSLCQRDSQNPTGARYTVCALQSSECQIQCFRETTEGPLSPAFSSFRHIIDEQCPALFLDFLPAPAANNESRPPPDIIVVHQDGTARRLSGDLCDLRWISSTVRKAEGSAQNPKVVYAHCVSYADASRGLLRRREDLLKECAASHPSFLLLVYHDRNHPGAELRMGVFEVPASLGSNLFPSNSSQQLRLLIDNPIPDSNRWATSADVWIDFHAPSARLSISSKNELVNYDLSGYENIVSSQLLTTDGFPVLFPLTANLAAGATSSAVQIYSTDFRSIQASYGLNGISRSKGKQENTARFFQFISYFVKIDYLVARRGRNLLGFQLADLRAAQHKSSQHESLLIDSLGRGAYKSQIAAGHVASRLGPGFSKTVLVPNKVERVSWDALKPKLNKLVEQNKGQEFGRLVAMELQTAATKRKPPVEGNPPRLPSAKQFVNHDRIHFILSKMFRAPSTPPTSGERKGEMGLDLTFVPDELFRWLARSGYLATCEIERALSTQPMRSRLKLGAVADSIIDRDPSLGLLLDYLQGANLSSVEEVMVVIRTLIKNGVAAVQSGSLEPPLLLEDGRQLASDRSMADGEAKNSSQAGSDPAVVAGALPKEYVNAMNRTLEIFCGFSPLKMTLAARTLLDRGESLSLIQFLRQQLFQSGHTSSWPSLPGGPGDPVPSLEAIVSVLSSCIDALGPPGLLGSIFDESIWQDLVPDLKVEISLALGGVEESTSLRGILQEMVRYGDATGCLRSSHRASLNQVVEADPKTPMTITMSGERSGERSHHSLQGHPSHPTLLPLSLTAENQVSKTKKRKGGGEVVERSRREVKHLLDRTVGEYSFERLAV